MPVVARAHDLLVNTDMGDMKQPEWMVRVKEDYFKAGQSMFESREINELLDEMDQNGVERAVLMTNMGRSSERVLSFVEQRPDLPQLPIDVTERRAAIPRDEPGGIQPRREIALPLHQQKPDKRLGSVQENPAGSERVFIVELDVGQCQQRLPPSANSQDLNTALSAGSGSIASIYRPVWQSIASVTGRNTRSVSWAGAVSQNLRYAVPSIGLREVGQ